MGFKQSRTETRPDRQLAVIISEELDERVHQLLDFRFVGAVFSRANTLAEAADHELSRGSFKCGARCAELLHDVMAIAPFVASAHRAQPERDMTGDGRGLGGTVVGESPITYIQRRVREIVAKMRDLERPP